MTRSILAILALLIFAGPASAMNADQLTDDAITFIDAQVGPDPAARPIVYADTRECDGNAWAVTRGMRCAGIAYTDRIALGWSVRNILERTARTGRDRNGYGRVVLHELLHRRIRPDHGLEEGAVDALSLDLYPAFARAEGFRIPADLDPCYPDEVQAVRTASAAATGGRWQARAARLWRRELWAADDATRAAMMAGAWAVAR